MKLLLWDIDGTLLLLRGVGRRATERAFREVLGVDDVTERTKGVVFAGSTDGRILREMADLCGVPRARFESARDAVRARYLELLNSEVTAFAADPVLPGVRAALAELASRPNVRLALLTGNYEPGARIKLGRFGLNAYFPIGGFAEDSDDRRVVAGAAHRRSCDHFARRFDPRDVVVIGDTAHDVDCGLHHGFRTVGVCTGNRPRGELESAGAHRVFEHLDVPGAADALLDV